MDKIYTDIFDSIDINVINIIDTMDTNIFDMDKTDTDIFNIIYKIY